MSNKRVINLLKRARKLVANGWTQGPLKVREGRTVKYCAYGALDAVTKSTDLLEAGIVALSGDPVVKAFARRQFIAAPSRWHKVIRYNEAKGRKQSQVVALFDRTIERLERQQQA